MSWWEKLLNKKSEMAAEVHNQAIEQPFVYPDAVPPAVDITTRLRWLEERVAHLERLTVEMNAED